MFFRGLVSSGEFSRYLMVYSFARIVATVAMNVEETFAKYRRLWIRLLKKGGNDHEMPRTI